VDASTNKISTVAGGGTGLGDNGPAIKAGLSSSYGVAIFPNTGSPKSMYIADTGDKRIRRVTMQ
jgi:hypothetical protein